MSLVYHRLNIYVPTNNNNNTSSRSFGSCIKSTQITRIAQIFANKICKIEYYLLNFNSIRLR